MKKHAYNFYDNQDNTKQLRAISREYTESSEEPNPELINESASIDNQFVDAMTNKEVLLNGYAYNTDEIFKIDNGYRVYVNNGQEDGFFDIEPEYALELIHNGNTLTTVNGINTIISFGSVPSV